MLELLALRFRTGDAPGGTIEMCFAGGGGVRLEVECIEIRLADLGAAWATSSKPDHVFGNPDPDDRDSAGDIGE